MESIAELGQHQLLGNNHETNYILEHAVSIKHKYVELSGRKDGFCSVGEIKFLTFT